MYKTKFRQRLCRKRKILPTGFHVASFESLSERNMPGLAKPRPTTPRRTILCCVLRNLGVPRLTEANAESISHRCVGAGRSERLFGLYLGHWPLLGALRFFLHCAHIIRRRSAPLHDNSRFESAGFTIRR